MEAGVRTEDQRYGGPLNAAVANELGKLIADFTGRGATRSRAMINQDLVVCVLEDSATRSERNLISAGKAELVRLQRDALQRAMAPQLIDAVERLTGRRVRSFMSGTDESGADSVEASSSTPTPLEGQPRSRIDLEGAAATLGSGRVGAGEASRRPSRLLDHVDGVT
jgi:uncharacterized protein YbcI